MRGGDRRRHFLPMVLTGIGLLAGILYLAVRLAAGSLLGRGEYQEMVSLGDFTYDQAFLEEAKKIEGLVSVAPVLEIPVRLKMGDYTMDTVFQAVELSELKMQGEAPEEIFAGSTPVLLVGKEALSSLTDENGHKISEKELLAFREGAEAGTLQYCLMENAEADALPEEGDASGEMGEPDWMEGTVAGFLTVPAEGIYIPYEQGKAMLEGRALDCKKILLTVNGKENMKKALALFLENS